MVGKGGGGRRGGERKGAAGKGRRERDDVERGERGMTPKKNTNVSADHVNDLKVCFNL